MTREDSSNDALINKVDSFRELPYKKLDRRGSNVERDKIIDSLKRYAKVHNQESFGFHDFDGWGDKYCSSATATRHLGGSWKSVMLEANLIPYSVYPMTNEEALGVVYLYMECWDQVSNAPLRKTFINYLRAKGCKHSINSIDKHFGKINRLRKRIVKYQNGDISVDQLTERFKPTINNKRSMSPKLRKSILDRDEYTCRRCGRSPKKHGVAVHVDHIKPVAKGGDDDPSNLQTLCDDCNIAKSDYYDDSSTN